MLHRQKTILQILREIGRPVHRMELTKFCFLLRMEYSSSGGSAFYDFVPYKYGPFSFALYQEIGKLESQQLLMSVNDNEWELTSDAAEIAPPSSPVANDIRRIVTRFITTSLDDLVSYVYESFPAFTVNSELRQLATKTTATPAVFTAGYEGISVDSFLNMLVQHGINRLLDVRQNPIARRYGFHKSTLNRLTNRLDIDYVHVPQLGIHSLDRRNVSTKEGFEKLFDQYEEKTLVTETDAISSVVEMINEKPSVLVCMEADPECCHRLRLANRISAITSLPVVHLRAAECLTTLNQQKS